MMPVRIRQTIQRVTLQAAASHRRLRRTQRLQSHLLFQMRQRRLQRTSPTLCRTSLVSPQTLLASR